MWWTTAAGRLEQAQALDPAAAAVERAVDAVLPKGRVKDLLHGTWLGHPVHPLLVALPIGLWSGASLLDLTGDRTAARRLVAAGVLSVLPTAAAGLADWSEVGAFQRPKRVGLVHAAANTVTAAVYAASWLARRRGAEQRGAALALVGLGTLTAGGYLGAHLAYSEGVGVNRNADSPVAPRDWTEAGDVAELSEGSLVRREVDGEALVLGRRDGALFALQATCSHYGAPLDEGQVVVDRGTACLECPWHGSRFRLADGSVDRGPATSPQRSYDVQQQGDRVLVRVRA